MQIHNRLIGTVLTAAVVLAAFAGAVVGQPAANGDKMALGRFAVQNYDTSSIKFRPEGLNADLRGPRLSMTSPQYDMAAPRLQITTRRSGKPPRMMLSTANATGGARIVLRRAGQNETTTVTCDRAAFTAATSGTAVGKIDLVGNVRSVTRGAAYPEPLVNVAKSGVINILGPNEIDIELTDGEFTGAFREPAPQRPKNR